MFRAILFDCNGVIADDEPIHLRLFQKVLREEGIGLTRKEYFKRYLAMDDRSCFKNVLMLHRRPHSKENIQGLVRRKAVYYEDAIKKHLRIFPGVKSFVRKHQDRCLLAVVSGALRREIDTILRRAGIAGAFSVIVSSENVRNGKPSSEGYLLAMKLLNRLSRLRGVPLKAKECLAIEDSIYGVEAAQKAGMRCLAITNSYSGKYLRKADFVAKSLAGLDTEKLMGH